MLPFPQQVLAQRLGKLGREHVTSSGTRGESELLAGGCSHHDGLRLGWFGSVEGDVFLHSGWRCGRGAIWRGLPGPTECRTRPRGSVRKGLCAIGLVHHGGEHRATGSKIRARVDALEKAFFVRRRVSTLPNVVLPVRRVFIFLVVVVFNDVLVPIVVILIVGLFKDRTFGDGSGVDNVLE